MFPTFDVPPQEAETIKSRRARKVKDDATSSLSGGSVRSEEATHSSSKKTGGFGWFSKSKKNEIKEIPVLPSLKQSQRHLQEPPLPPPTKALPSPPPLPGLLNPMSETSSRNDPRRRTQHSDYSQASSSSAGGSVFSRQSRAETAISEESFSRKSRTETVLSEESFSSHVDNNRQAQGPFARALAKMESAGPRIMSARLEEQWEGLDDDESYQEVAFEKRLWALTAYQRLVQNKQLQSPAHELLSNSRPADQRRILHLYGSLADGWMLAACYSAATVYTVSCTQSTTTPTLYPAPLNHHPLYVPSVASPLPFPDNYFDAIISRSISTILGNEEWAPCLFDSMRVLKPGGQLEILSLDAHISREGPMLSAWADHYTTDRLEAQGLSMQPSDTVLDTMDIVGLEDIRRARVALPAHAAPSASTKDIIETSRMMMLLGRHFYQDLYARFLHVGQGEEWFWERKDIREECNRQQAKMVLTITRAQKPSVTMNRQSFLSM